MEQALLDMRHLGVKAINWSGGGEPTLHHDFQYFVDVANNLGLLQGIFTNGYKKIPNQQMFSWVRISLTEKGFGAITKPTVPFGVCLNQTVDHDELSLDGICKDAKKFGASYFQVRPALAGKYYEQPLLETPTFLLMNETKKFKVYTTDYKYYDAVRPRGYTKCYGYHFCPSIDWNGKLCVCLYMSGRKKFNLGDLNHMRMEDIWEVLPDYLDIEERCQSCCKNHEINKALNTAKNVKDPDFL